MQLILFDTADRNKLYPFTQTRSIAEIRVGILTQKERWEKLTGFKAFILTEAYLQPLYEKAPPGETLFIDASVFPDKNLYNHILSLQNDEALHDKHDLIAGKANTESLTISDNIRQLFKSSSLATSVKKLNAPWQIFQWNEQMLLHDFTLLTTGKASQRIDDTNRTINAGNIFIEDGANISHSILNAATGSIYIGKGATIMEDCKIRGPFAIGEGSVLKMGSKIYGATTLGPSCTAGGEIKNSVLFGYSNKAHDGYLGDSVLGEWCNLGAGTTTSNIKNTGGEVKVWSQSVNDFIAAGNKCGMLMGDYSRAAINTSVNTGAVIGVCANVFGNGLTPKFINDFSWGIGEELYDFKKAVNDIANWKKMKQKTVSANERDMLKHIFETRLNAK